MVVGFGILLIHEVGIVGTHQFNAVFLGQFYQHLVGLLLHREGLTIGALQGILHLMALQLQIVVVAPEALVPLDGLTGAGDVALQYLRRHLTSDTGRTDNQVLVVFLQFLAVCSRTVVETVDPGIADELDQVLIAVGILGQHDEVIAAKVFLGLFQALVTTTGHIHLTTEDGLEGFETVFLALLVQVETSVMKFFNTEHITVIGDRHASHAVLNSFGYKLLDTRLSIKY